MDEPKVLNTGERRVVRSPGERLPSVRNEVVKLQPKTRVDLRTRPGVDICFVFDTTGSMSNKIRGLIACMTDLVDQLANLALDWRVTVVPFGDVRVAGDRVESQYPFVSGVEEAKELLRTMPRFSGGLNRGESSIEAMRAALEKPRRDKAVAVVVLITDESAHGEERAGEIGDELTRTETICFVASPPEAYYKAWASEHGGCWLEIGPSMDTRVLTDLLRSLVSDVATVAHEVHRYAAGSVREYLALGSGGGRAPVRRDGEG